MKKVIIGAVLFATAFGCGDSANNESNNEPANSSANSATTNSGTNTANSNANSQNAGIGAGEWTAAFEGGEDVFDLPDVTGSVLGTTALGENFTLTGMGDANLNLTVMKDAVEPLEPGTYPPTLLSISFSENDYTCVSVDVMVTFTSVDPAVGTFAGTMQCSPQMVTEDSMFDTEVTGAFSE